MGRRSADCRVSEGAITPSADRPIEARFFFFPRLTADGPDRRRRRRRRECKCVSGNGSSTRASKERIWQSPAACLPFRTQNRFVATPPFTATRDCNFQRNCDPTRVRRVASFPLSSLLPIPISLFLLSLIISRDHQLTPKWPRAPSFGRASAARTYGEIDRNSIGEKRRSLPPTPRASQ